MEATLHSPPGILNSYPWQDSFDTAASLFRCGRTPRHDESDLYLPMESYKKLIHHYFLENVKWPDRLNLRHREEPEGESERNFRTSFFSKCKARVTEFFKRESEKAKEEAPMIFHNRRTQKLPEALWVLEYSNPFVPSGPQMWLSDLAIVWRGTEVLGSPTGTPAKGRIISNGRFLTHEQAGIALACLRPLLGRY